MRTLIFIFSLFFFLTINVEAQSALYFEGGVNLSKVKFSGYEFSKPLSRSGIFLGLRHIISINKKLGINTELQYSQDGFRVIPEHDIDTRYHVLRVIPHLEYRLNQTGGLFAGVNFGLNFKEETRLYKNSWNTIDREPENLIKDSDIGLTVGGRYYLKKFTFSFKYHHGLQKSSKFTHTDEEGRNIGTTSGQNRSFQIGIGYAILSKNNKMDPN